MTSSVVSVSTGFVHFPIACGSCFTVLLTIATGRCGWHKVSSEFVDGISSVSSLTKCLQQ